MTRRTIRAVILAGGSSSRTAPVQKLLATFRGKRLVDQPIEAARAWNPIVVAGDAVAEALRNLQGCTVLRNDHSERGMSYSLKIADAAIALEAGLLVFLADKPLVSRYLAQRICAANAQIAYPEHAVERTPGHPVFFDVSVRSRIAALPDGDTLHLLRDDATLRRRRFSTFDAGAFFDVDEIAALE